MLQHIRDLFGHQAWADAVFFESWNSAQGALEDEDLRRRTSHIIMTQRGFLKLVRGEEAVRPPDLGTPGFLQLKTESMSNNSAFAFFLEDVADDQLSLKIKIPWFQDPPCSVSVADALVQAVMHTQHHRAQNLARLRQLGGVPANVDWILWLREGKPEPQWE
jgi:uncharacterized damage-inducible protein DinB